VNHRHENIDGVDVSYYTMGEHTAPAVVLLHGGGQTAATWRRVGSALAHRYYCVAPDLRGHGDTAWHPEGCYNLAGYAHDLRRLLDHLDIHRPHLVGMSLGGQTSLYAACHGLDLASLTLVDVGPRLVPAGGARITEFLGVTSYPSFEAALDRAAEFSPQRTRESLAESLVRSMRQQADGRWTWKWDPRRAASRADRAKQAELLWSLLGRITCPVLVVRGAESPLFSADLARDFRDTLEASGVAARIVTVPGAGHAVQTDQPAKLAEIVDDFFSYGALATGAPTQADHYEIRKQR
jgi:pimeloyl-ACP methyl ester carboxylesterase